jgi:hypothetical protein
MNNKQQRDKAKVMKHEPSSDEAHANGRSSDKTRGAVVADDNRGRARRQSEAAHISPGAAAVSLIEINRRRGSVRSADRNCGVGRSICGRGGVPEVDAVSAEIGQGNGENDSLQAFARVAVCDLRVAAGVERRRWPGTDEAGAGHYRCNKQRERRQEEQMSAERTEKEKTEKNRREMEAEKKLNQE